MKYIKKLNPVTLTNLQNTPFEDENGAPITMTIQSFILQRLIDSKFGTGMEGLLSATQIKTAVEESGDYIELETKDWELLSNVVRQPSSDQQYNPNIAHCLVPIIQAILNATDKKETKKSKSK